MGAVALVQQEVEVRAGSCDVGDLVPRAVPPGRGFYRQRRCVHRQQATWLLGLEGVALLRDGAGDDLGGGFVQARLAEVRRMIDAIDDAPLVEVGDIAVHDGYAIWASTYDGQHNSLFGPDWQQP
jgi:hypothetical protein